MRGCACFLLAVLLRANLLAQMTANTDALQREVLQAENQRRDAVIKGDRAMLDRLMSDDYKVLVMTGAVMTRQANWHCIAVTERRRRGPPMRWKSAYMAVSLLSLVAPQSKTFSGETAETSGFGSRTSGSTATAAGK